MKLDLEMLLVYRFNIGIKSIRQKNNIGETS